MKYDWLAPQYVGWIAHGYGVTLLLAASVIAAATILGAALALARGANTAVLRRAAAGYVMLLRNAPLIVQLLFWYFGVATLLPESWMTWLNATHRISIGPLALAWPSFEFISGFVALTLYTSTFVGEEIRAGIAGVGTGQRAAAAALGLGRYAAFRYVVLPQAVRIAVPSLVGQYMNVVKNSSLAMAIGVAELSYATRQVDTATFKTFEAFGAATVLYILTIALMEAALHAYRQGMHVSGRSTRA